MACLLQQPSALARLLGAPPRAQSGEGPGALGRPLLPPPLLPGWPLRAGAERTLDWALSRATRACCSACWTVSVLLCASSCSCCCLCRSFWLWLSCTCSWLTLASNSEMVCSRLASSCSSSHTCWGRTGEDRGVAHLAQTEDTCPHPSFPQRRPTPGSSSQIWTQQWCGAFVLCICPSEFVQWGAA